MQKRQSQRCGWCVLAVGLLFGLAVDAEAEEISWHKDLKKAAKESSRSKKPLLVTITASWCGYCHKMSKHTFSDQRVVRHVNSCFIAATIDADANGQLVSSIGVESLPTTFIISPELKVLKKITGYHSAAEIDKHLRKFCGAKHKQVKRSLVRSAARQPQ